MGHSIDTPLHADTISILIPEYSCDAPTRQFRSYDTIAGTAPGDGPCTTTLSAKRTMGQLMLSLSTA